MAGKYKGKEKQPEVVLEAVTDQSLWIWHIFFGRADKLNDINILKQSSLFKGHISGKSWDFKFKFCGWIYKHAYYLVNGIYLPFSTLIKSKGSSVDKTLPKSPRS